MDTLRKLYNDLERAGARIPGQAAAARQAAFELASQLSRSERPTPTVLLLHGPEDGSAQALALALAQVLAQGLGYSYHSIDCSQIRDSMEASVIDGLPRMWSNARPGVVTSAIHENGRSVILFDRVDRGLPRAIEALREPLLTGRLHDNYGLESGTDRSNPSDVDCRDAVFIFTASEGSQWYADREVSVLLASDGDEARSTIRQALRDATREYRGHEIRVFDGAVLDHIARHLVLVRPVAWNDLVVATVQALQVALSELRDRHGLHALDVAQDDLSRLARIHLLGCGSEAGLPSVQPQSIEQGVLRALQFGLLEAEGMPPERVSITVSAEAARELETVLAQLGEDPRREMERRAETVRFDVEWTDRGALRITALRRVASQRLQDFVGTVRLTARVPKVTLDDVAGHDDAKVAMREVIAHLRDPDALSGLGIDLPRGMLLCGPPGTGKTLLAQGFAGEAGLPFVSVAGSDLLQLDAMRRLYQVARRNSPCLVFIDEADALGTRGLSPMADAAITRLLTEIQGFGSVVGVFHILATNRPECLDSALTRPGRIDRRFFIGPLDRDARLPLVRRIAHTCGLDESAVARLLKHSGGMTGAELAQVRRECGLRMLRAGTRSLGVDEVLDELGRMRHGARLGTQLDETVRERLAVHEIGHALVHQLLLPDIPIERVSIVPREGEGVVGGFLALDVESRGIAIETPATVRAIIATVLAGRESERLRYGDEAGRSAGARHDLAVATRLAWRAVAQAGMDERFGLISLDGFAAPGDVPPALRAQASARVRAWMDDAARTARRLLSEHAETFELLVRTLLERGELDGQQIRAFVGQSNRAQPTERGTVGAGARIEGTAPDRAGERTPGSLDTIRAV
jgi:cell division protease FtsH